MQDGKVFTCASRELKKHEENYLTHVLELAALVHALKIWRYYLIGNKYEIFMDHKSLKYIFTQTDLNLRQKRWLELIKDYHLSIQYHPGKANVVANQLSRKSYYHYMTTLNRRPELAQEVHQLNLQIIPQGTLNALHIHPTLKDQIKEAQDKDEETQRHKELSGKEIPGFKVDEQGKLWYKDRIRVPQDEALRGLILDEAHYSPYSIHPGSTKMYMDLKQKYWWNGMKGDITEYVARCDTCR
jgi:hypothetical protein